MQHLERRFGFGLEHDGRNFPSKPARPPKPAGSRHALRLWLKALRLRTELRVEPRAALDDPIVWSMAGWLLLVTSLLAPEPTRRLGLRIVALRRFERGFGLRLTQRSLKRWLTPKRVSVWRERRVGWDRYYGEFGNIAREPALKTSLLLKEPGPNGEKGVLYSSFEYNWMKILGGRDPRAFFREYILVGASSSSPSDFAVFASLQGLSDDPIFIGISNRCDVARYKTFGPYIRPLPIMACDLCDPDYFQPRPRHQRCTDILMVAHFARLKRHWLLFEALRKMPKNLRVVLIGRRFSGRSEHDILAEAMAFGVRQDLTVCVGAEIAEVARQQCDAKLAIACSKREGSCVAVTEALFADTPVAMMADAHIGARIYINRQTGRLVKRRDMPVVLMEMLERPEAYSPRAWATAHISAQRSSTRLNAVLRDHCLANGRPWTRDIAPLCWRYVPRYLDENDAVRLRAGVERLRERHGIALEEFVSEADARRRHSRASRPLAT